MQAVQCCSWRSVVHSGVDCCGAPTGALTAPPRPCPAVPQPGNEDEFVVLFFDDQPDLMSWVSRSALWGWVEQGRPVI